MTRRALLWGHCHQKATGGMDAERSVLQRMGASVDHVQGGCCGLAGSWGFEPGKYEISMTCGDHALLPAVREASDETVVVADGFSCRTQIAQAGTGRQALHIAQVIQLARGGAVAGATSGRPEDHVPARPRAGPASRARRAAGVGAAGAAVAVAAAAARRRRR
jgi:hypothetical protein